MKKMNLFLAVVGMSAATSVMAQVDVTPANWKFDNLQRGSGDKLFVREGAAIGGNFVKQQLEGGRQGFRYADNLQGALSVAHWTGGEEKGYAAMTEAEKTLFEAFYSAFRIADGGVLGNILIYQGKSSTAIDVRAQKNTEAMVAPNIYLVSDYKPLSGTLGIYKVSIPIRIVVNPGKSADINMYVGNSWWDGVPFAGSGGSDYANFHILGEADINDYWTLYEFEIEVKNNSDSKFDFWPLMIKFGLNGSSANESIIMFNDFKIEKMSGVTLGGKVKITDLEWNDIPTNISNAENNENLIVVTNEKDIQVIDAKSAIEVYNAGGQLIQKVEPTSTTTTIPIDQKGVYVVKTTKTTQKVVF